MKVFRVSHKTTASHHLVIVAKTEQEAGEAFERAVFSNNVCTQSFSETITHCHELSTLPQLSPNDPTILHVEEDAPDGYRAECHTWRDEVREAKRPNPPPCLCLSVHGEHATVAGRHHRHECSLREGLDQDGYCQVCNCSVQGAHKIECPLAFDPEPEAAAQPDCPSCSRCPCICYSGVL